MRLKWAQREESLSRGVSLITWTFDPMQARNANLNLRRLGASATEFLENFYGVTTSSLHHGLPTDRLLVRWDLSAPRVLERMAQGEPPRTAAAPHAPRINDVKWQAGWPVSSEPRLDLDAPELLLEIPPEWDILCRAAPRVAETPIRLTAMWRLSGELDVPVGRPKGGRRRQAATYGARLNTAE